MTVEVPPPRDAVLPPDVVLLPRDTALPLLLELPEDRCSLVDVRLGSLVRLGRGGSGSVGIVTRDSLPDELEELPLDELPLDELEPDDPELPDAPELVVGGGSVRLTARWALAE